MIGFWIVAALITAFVLVLLGLPLIRHQAAAAADTERADLEVYRDQLAELERDRARGLLDAEQAAALEAEIGRRMLAASRAAAGEMRPGPPARRLTVALTVAVPVAALSLYLAVGHPDLPAMPLADRAIAPHQDPAKILAMVEKARARLRPVPEDLDNWVLVAEAYGKLGKKREAVDAFRTAVSLAPEDASLKAALAVALVDADAGTVGEEAKQLFAAVPADSPARPEARFYLALADAQTGDMKSALKAWQSLLADSPADAPWVDAVRDRIAMAAQSLGLDPARETPQPRPPEQAEDQKGPSAADVQAAQQMSPEQRTQMIRGMVAQLAAKLEANPDDEQGWRKLARAYQVLGETDKAKDAEAKAQAAAKKAGPR